MKNLLPVAFLLAFSALPSAHAEDSVAAGRAFAEKVCSACHVVSEDQDVAPILKPPAPSFLDLARRSDVSEEFLRRFLKAPHGNKGKSRKMPNPRLLDYQIDEIVAYFASLRNR